MKVRTFVEVIKKDEDHVVARTRTDFGVVDIKRTFRKHTKAIRELKKNRVFIVLRYKVFCIGIHSMNRVLGFSTKNQKISDQKIVQQMNSEGQEGKIK